MDTLTPPFLACEAMIQRKERLLEAAIRRHFGDKPWSEPFLQEHCSIEINQNAVETLLIDGKPMIEFHPVLSDIVVEGEQVKIRMTQPYRILYDELVPAP